MGQRGQKQDCQAIWLLSTLSQQTWPTNPPVYFECKLPACRQHTVEWVYQTEACWQVHTGRTHAWLDSNQAFITTAEHVFGVGRELNRKQKKAFFEHHKDTLKVPLLRHAILVPVSLYKTKGLSAENSCIRGVEWIRIPPWVRRKLGEVDRVLFTVLHIALCRPPRSRRVNATRCARLVLLTGDRE